MGEGAHEDALDGGSDAGGGGLGFVSALGIGGFGTDIGGAIIAIAGHGDVEVGSHGLGGELVLDEEFAGQMQDPDVTDGEAGDVDGGSGEGALEEGELGGLKMKGRRRTLDGGMELVSVEVGCRREMNGEGTPFQVGLPDRFADGVPPGTRHAIGQALGQDRAVGWGTIIVFPGADIAAGAIEMDMQGAGKGLVAEESGDAGEVWIGDAGPVEGLGMGGVIGEDGQGGVVIPEGEGDDEGINHAFGCGAEFGVLGGGVTNGTDLAVGVRDAAVGSNLMDFSPTPADVGPGAEPVGEGLNGAGGPGHGRSGDGGVKGAGGDVARGENPMSGEVGDWSVVLVDCMEGDAIPGCSSGGGEEVTEVIVGFIGDTEPIDGAEDDGVAGATDDNPAAAQGEFAGTDHGIVGETGASGGIGIGIEGGDFELGAGLEAGDQAGEAGDEEVEAGEHAGRVRETGKGSHPQVRGGRGERKRSARRRPWNRTLENRGS